MSLKTALWFFCIKASELSIAHGEAGASKTRGGFLLMFE